MDCVTIWHNGRGHEFLCTGANKVSGTSDIKRPSVHAGFSAFFPSVGHRQECHASRRAKVAPKGGENSRREQQNSTWKDFHKICEAGARRRSRGRAAGRGPSTSGLVQRAAAAAQPDLSLSCEDVAKGEEGLVLSPESSKPTADHCSIRRVAFAVSRCMHYADLCVSWVS